MFKIVEPQWWVNLSKSLFAWMQASVFRSYRIPIFADIFILTYPFYLLALYIYGIAKKKAYFKISAIYIFAGVVMSFIMNIVIQFFLGKSRPNIVLWLQDLKTKTIFDKLLPSSSFPSGHAVVSMSIAMMSLFRGIKNKDRKFLRFGGILIIFSLITSFSRVASWVHRPTDVIAGSVLWIIVPLVLMWKPIYKFGTWIAEKIAKAI